MYVLAILNEQWLYLEENSTCEHKLDVDIFK